MAAADSVRMVREEVAPMTFNELTAARIRSAMQAIPGLSERHMFGGIAFMLEGNMCCGVFEDNLVVRVGPDAYDEALSEPHTRPMDFTGRPLRGFIYVDRGGFEYETSLRQWIHRGMSFVRTLRPKSVAQSKTSGAPLTMLLAEAPLPAVMSHGLEKGLHR
jgi:TfoX/Sxy family transcriptional regulator of competence genes